MTLSELIAATRLLGHDETEPYFWTDEAIIGWLNEAQAEACIRGRLLHEAVDPAVCEIAVTEGQAFYPLHESVLEITRAGFLPDDSETCHWIALVSEFWRDAAMRPRLWPPRAGVPLFAVQKETQIRLAPVPDGPGKLLIEAYRLPVTMAGPDDAPEIHKASHAHLVDWALYRGFSRPDMEAFDPERSRLSLAAFERFFGLAVDSDLRRMTREDVPQVCQAFMP